MPQPWKGDCELMPVVTEGVNDPKTLLYINSCRLYVRAFHLSDIVHTAGRLLLDDAWIGYNPLNMDWRETWPAISQPCKEAWKTRRWALKRSVLSRSRRLKTPLGIWATDKLMQGWYYHPESYQLYRQQESSSMYKRQLLTCYLLHGVLPCCSTRRLMDGHGANYRASHSVHRKRRNKKHFNP